MDDLINNLKPKLEGEVFTGTDIDPKYSHDTSIFTMDPSTVIAPKNAADVEKIVTFIADNKKKHPDLSVTARSAGTDMSGGVLTESVLLDFMPHFTQVHEITKEHTVVEPGVFFRDLEKQLKEKGLLYPPYPASKDLCAMGGIVNNNSAGEKTLQYGKTNKYIQEYKIVLSDGKLHTIKKLSKTELEKKIKEDSFEGKLYKKLYKLFSDNKEIIAASRPQVSKNSSGYNIWDVMGEDGSFDLTQVICGAQGTLGMVTQAQLRVVPMPHKEKLYVIFLDGLEQLPSVTQDILKLKPTSLEITDDHTFKIYLRYAREMAAVLGSKSLFATFKLFWPETLLILRHGMPKLVLLVEFEGDETTELNHEMKALGEIVKTHKLNGHPCKNKSEAAKYWKLRRDTFKLLREKIKDRHSTPFVDDIIIKPEHFPTFWPKLTAILDKYKLFYTISGHLGDGNLHIIPLMDLKKAEERDKIFPVTDEVYKLVLEYKGSITAEHNDGLIRSPYLKEEFGEKVYKIFEEVKDAFDPDNIFNPHKKVGVTKEFSHKYIIKD
jgi:FAD/FMN-containing dehydrogenase